MIEHYSDLIDSSLSIKEVTDLLIDRALILPSKGIMKPILRALMLNPSHLTSIEPIVVAYGLPGTGKSSLLKLACCLYGKKFNSILAENSTPTSIRNQTMMNKYGDEWLENLKDGEDLPDENTIIKLLDDVTPNIRSNSFFISFLKCGYCRSTATITIAEVGNGKNIIFDCYGKVFTGTCFPIWSLPELFELKRRSVIIQFVHYDALEFDDSENNYSPLDDEYIDLDEYDFTGFNKLYNFWDNNSFYYQFIQKECKSLIKRAFKGSKLNIEQSKLFFDTAITHCVVAGCKDNKSKVEIEADYFIRCLEDYLSNSLERLINDKSALELWLTKFLKDKTEMHENLRCPYRLEIDSIELKRSIKIAFDNGEINESFKPSRINEIMRTLGYRQEPSQINANGKMIWTKF